MKLINELTDLIAEFPGVGPRAARRIVQFMLGKDSAFREKLAQVIAKIGKSVSPCTKCFRYTDSQKLCSVCADKTREQGTFMVVEKDVDVESIESSGTYRGQYFVLGGLIPMARQRKNGNGVRTKELIGRIEKDGLSEVIFAFSTTPEGDYTAQELMRELKTLNSKLKTSTLGRGLSVGLEIEYADQETLRNALKNRS
jgi:recombination protein RecR